jgi:uncharacterized protein (TIGR02145 family)
VEVLLYLSTDRGSRWEGPLKSCSGDLGPNVAPGTGKRIRWEVLKDRELVGDGIAFKVVARGGVVLAKGGKLSTAEVAQRPWLNPSLTYGSVQDVDGNTYATIQIGKQVWMAENLRAARYCNGDTIPNVKNANDWGNLTSGAWAHYDNDSKYEVPYGKLYNWYSITDSRQVCPIGWHMPSDAEWTILNDYLRGKGGKLKSINLWNPPNTSATNGSGFSGIPSALRYDKGYFSILGFDGNWWGIAAGVAWRRSLYSNGEDISRDYNGLQFGLSVRCLKD